jgi:hypothetical protein
MALLSASMALRASKVPGVSLCHMLIQIRIQIQLYKIIGIDAKLGPHY